jgi:hypothetical protein
MTVPALRVRIPLLTGLLLANPLGARGPIHPQWKNMANHEIEVVYFDAPSVVRTTLESGAVRIPRVFADFQKVQHIDMARYGKSGHSVHDLG